MYLRPKAANSASFKSKKKVKEVTQFSVKDQFLDLAFVVNLFKHINKLNTK